MAILTDLPNELLLSIIAGISPLHIDSFALSCKRISHLCTDTIQEHDIVRSRFWEMQPLVLLRTVFLHPELALYPTSLRIVNGDVEEESQNQAADISAWALQSPYTAFHETNGRRRDFRALAMPLLITSLPNLRKIRLYVRYPRYLLDAVSQIVNASHEPLSNLRQPLAFSMLKEVCIVTLCDSSYGIKLAMLLAMIPSVRKLEVLHIYNSAPFVCPYPHYVSGVTEMVLNEYVDSSYLVELISRTNGLQKFTYRHLILIFGAKLEPRLLAELLKQHAGHSLLYLSLLTEYRRSPAECPIIQHRNSNDLSLGSLRGFSVLRVLVACVDMFIKTYGHSEYQIGTGTVQRLVSWLPASLETLVLHSGLEPWDKDTIRLLFRGLRNKKQTRIPNLRLINFVNCPDFQHLLSDETKAACQEIGVKLGYTPFFCRNPDCTQLSEQLDDWEGRPWIEGLDFCCYHLGWR